MRVVFAFIMNRALIATFLLPLCGFVLAFIASWACIIDDLTGVMVFAVFLAIAMMTIPTWLALQLRRQKPYWEQIVIALAWLFLLAAVAIVAYFQVLGYAYATW